MIEETQVSPVAETQNPAPVEATQAPEVVEPETNEAERVDETPEDPRDKYEQLQARLAQYEQPEQQPQQPDVLKVAEYIAEIKEHQKIGVDISKAGRAKFPDFDRAISVVIEEIGALYDQAGMLTPTGKAFVECEAPAMVIHAIGTNPDLAAELAGLSPTKLARRLDRLEIELSKPKEPPRSNAPKPIQPVKASGSQSGPSADDSPEEWRRKFIAQRQQRNRY
jgi:hypothetical protein